MLSSGGKLLTIPYSPLTIPHSNTKTPSRGLALFPVFIIK